MQLSKGVFQTENECEWRGKTILIATFRPVRIPVEDANILASFAEIVFTSRTVDFGLGGC